MDSSRPAPDLALDPHLPAEPGPVEEERRARVNVELAGLAAAVVREERDSALVVGLHQDHAGRRRPSALAVARATALASKPASRSASSNQRPNRTSGSGSRSPSSKGRSGGSGMRREASVLRDRRTRAAPSRPGSLAGRPRRRGPRPGRTRNGRMKVDPQPVGVTDRARFALRVASRSPLCEPRSARSPRGTNRSRPALRSDRRRARTRCAGTARRPRRGPDRRAHPPRRARGRRPAPTRPPPRRAARARRRCRARPARSRSAAAAARAEPPRAPHARVRCAAPRRRACSCLESSIPGLSAMPTAIRTIRSRITATLPGPGGGAISTPEGR